MLYVGPCRSVGSLLCPDFTDPLILANGGINIEKRIHRKGHLYNSYLLLDLQLNVCKGREGSAMIFASYMYVILEKMWCIFVPYFIVKPNNIIIIVKIFGKTQI